VNADKVRLAQCLANLLINAAKFTAPGGEIGISSHTLDDEVVVDVSDNGIGISAEFMPRVFDLFTQGDRSLGGSKSGGLGLGLSICKKLMQMHGGTVAVRSAGLGQGATFTIRLPRVDAAVQSAPSTITSLHSARRVLIVDDNRDAANSLAMLLQLEGHVTTTVYSGEEALQRMIAFSPEVVLLDIGLPQLNGYEVAQRMRSIAPSVRLIAVSGYGQPEDKQRSYEAGFFAHLVKPVTVPDVTRVLATDSCLT
jgi:CheY-like chemotaxis protein